MPLDPIDPNRLSSPPAPLGPAPADSDGFDAWARLGNDTWRRDEVTREAQRRWADPTISTADRALAGLWAYPAGNPTVADLTELVDDPALDPVLRGRLQILAAIELIDSRPEEAVITANRALAAVADNVAPTRTRIGVWLSGAEVLARTGRPDLAMELLTQASTTVGTAADAPAWGRMVIEAEKLGILAPAAEDAKAVASAAHAVASEATTIEPSPPAFDVIVKMSGILAATGGGVAADPLLEYVLDHLEAVPEALGLRFQALMVLADVRFAHDGIDAAIEVQRRAIDTVAPLGDTPMLGWARRGLAFQLRAADRLGESAEQFGDAAAVLDRAGQNTDAGAMRLERATTELLNDSPDQAETIALDVLASLDEFEDPGRQVLELHATQILAQVATYQEMPGQAADRWLHVAELAQAVGASPLEARIAAAQLLAASGDLDASMALFDRAEMDASDASEPALAISAVLGQRAEVLHDAERFHDAAEMARVAANHARTGGDERQAVWLTLFAGEALLSAGEAGAAEPILRDALDQADTAGLTDLRATTHGHLADALTALGRDDEAKMHSDASEKFNI